MVCLTACVLVCVCVWQVGFTTDPRNGRSTLYSSDLAKAFNIPIFHCNGDDPLAVVTAFEMAVEYRQKFGDDCIVDMICYRRYGHNELDQVGTVGASLLPPCIPSALLPSLLVPP